LPPMAVSWEDRVRAEAREWAAANPRMRGALTFLMPVLGAGLGFLAVSGSVLTIALATAGSTLGGGWLANVITRMHLEGALRHASDEWTTTRRGQIAAHLDWHLFGKVFAPWQDRVTALKAAPVGECFLACDALDALGREIGRGE